MKLRKKLLLLVVFLIVFILWGSWYLEKIFLPEKIKTLTATFLKEKLDLDSSVESVDFSFWKGIQLTGVTVNNPPEFKQELLKVKKAVLKPALLPLLRKRLVISTIFIDSPQFSLERNEKKDWNIASFLPAEKSSKKQFSLGISKITIREGDISFIDRGIEPSFSRHIKNFNLNLTPLGRYLALSYNLSLSIEEDKTQIKARGKIFPPAKRGGINLDIRHLNLANFSPYYKKLTAFSFDNGYLDLNTELSLNKNELSGQSSLNLSQIVFFLKDVYDTPLVFPSGKIASRIYLNRNSEEIKFDNALISIGGIEINGRGGIKSFKTNPELSFNFSTPALDLKDLTFACPTASLDFYKSLQAEGPFKISQAEIFMPFKRTAETDYNLRAELQKIGLNLPFLKARIKNLEGKGQLNISRENKKLNWQGDLECLGGTISQADRENSIEKVNGRLQFSQDSVSAKPLKGYWENTPLTLSGQIENFSQPKIDLKLSGPETNLKCRAAFLKDSGELVDLSGNYQGLPIKVKGSFTKLNPLTVDWRFESAPLKLEKLIRILPPDSKTIYEKLDLSGEAKFKGALRGDFFNWKRWKADGNFYFPEFHISKCNLKGLSSDFNLTHQKLSLPNIKTIFCGGAIQGDFQINLAEAYPGYQGNLLLSNIDLGRVKKETDWKDLDIQGLASAEINCNGFGADWNRVKGRGWIHLQGSRLWEIPLLGELANILLIPGLDKTIIREGHSNFNINQGRVYTKDLELLSDNLSIKAQGSAGFDTTLDFDIMMQFSGALRKEAKNLTKLADLVLKTVEKLLIQIKLEGTITDPKYTINAFPIEKMLEKKIKDKLGNIFKDLLEEKE